MPGKDYTSDFMSPRSKVLDRGGAPVAYCVARVAGWMSAQRQSYPSWRKAFNKARVLPVPDHYYEPVNFDTHAEPWPTPRDLPGLDLNLGEQLELLASFTTADELAELRTNWPSQGAGVPRYDFVDSIYPEGDSDFLYSLTRHLKPKTVVEVGCGDSTKVFAAALDRNRAEGSPARHICIEPFEQPWLKDLTSVELQRAKVQDSDLSVLAGLQPNDVVFLDTTHAVRAGGDVLFDLLQLVPQIPNGVYVHVHDIFTPYDYPNHWVHELRWLWTEQYLLEALLSNTDRYHVVGALFMLSRDQRAEWLAAFPFLAQTTVNPQGFWFRVGDRSMEGVS